MGMGDSLAPLMRGPFGCYVLAGASRDRDNIPDLRESVSKMKPGRTPRFPSARAWKP